MPSLRMTTLLCLLSAVMISAAARGEVPAKVSFAVDPAKVVNRVDVGIHGQFLEHIFNSVHGGLWGDMVLNGSLEADSQGGWACDGDTIGSIGQITDSRLVFGDAKWRDYEITLDARKREGDEGFIVMFRVAGNNRFYWANLGGWSNKMHGFEKNRGPLGKHAAGAIEQDRWYKVRIRCEGARYQVWLDGESILDATDEKDPILAGAVGLSGWGSKVQFRNIKVASLDGKTLFEGLPPNKALVAKPAYWQFFGEAEFANDSREPVSEASSIRIRRDAVQGEAALRQGPKMLRQGEQYSGMVYLKGTAAQGVRVRLVDKDGTASFTANIQEIGPGWKKFPFHFKAPATVEDASLEIALVGAGDVNVDFVSLFSRSSLDCGGFRPDLLKAIADLKPASIRYPGGCFASAYHWKECIGPREKRKYFPNVIWGDRDSSQFGTDEFMLLCEKVGAEPIIVVNMNRDVQEALDWLEYCNGDETTPWGKRRAANGHPKPYNVKYWEIDNETWGLGPAAYAKVVTRFSQAIRKQDPSVKIIACGSYGYDDGQSNSKRWNKQVLDAAATDFDYLSIHYYNGIGYPQDYVDDPRRFEKFMRDDIGALIASSANPSIKIYCSEWGMMNANWRSGLYAGGILNAFERAGDIVPMACPAVWLQTAAEKGDPRWASCSILFDHRTWHRSPTYVVQKMWRDHYAPQRIALAGPDKPVDAVATKSENGETLYVKAVNASKDAVAVEVTIQAGFAAGAASLLVAEGLEDASITLAEPNKIEPKSAEVKAEGQTLRFTMPPLSAGVLTVREGKPH